MFKAATTAVLLLAATGPAAMAQAPNPGQFLQGLLSGNQGQDQAVRDAFERGYRRGREDQQRADRDDRRGPPPPPDRGYPDYNGAQQRGYAPPPPPGYSR